MDMTEVARLPNEMEAAFTRSTRDGRKVTYRLKVLQQPERARACGSGAKSSADRRPVDPPPIVELRIYEGENADHDITFQLSANYFLFAQLERSRKMAQGRVLQDPDKLPVLTGTPVAGMVYLDRPTPAGYFIFPDLSVRHEGHYRLSFNLYEELKETEDDDQIDDAASKVQGVGSAHVTHRLEVKSQAFQVWSAKKFPGLASSTILSRTVAEQGCRVRIRRDVRMRRRDKCGKSDEWDEHEDNTAYDRARQASTPDAYAQAVLDTPHAMWNRGRSTSIASHVSNMHQGSLSRRTSTQDIAQQYLPHCAYPSQPSGPTTPQGAYPQHSGYAATSAASYPAVYHQPSQAPLQPYQSYNHTQQASAASHQSYYGYSQAHQQHSAAPSQHDTQHIRNDSVVHSIQADRRSSVLSMSQAPSYSAYATPILPASSQAPTPIHGGGLGALGSLPSATPTRQPSRSSTTGHALPAMTAPLLPPLPPLNTTIAKAEPLETSSPATAVNSPYAYPRPELPSALARPPLPSAKRSYSTVFDTRHMKGPLRGGARPEVTSGPNIDADVDEVEEDGVKYSPVRMSYRRADGREIARPLPPAN